MQSIHFDSGESCKQYIINDDASHVIRINLTDLNMPARIRAAAEQMDALITENTSDMDNPAQLTQLDTQLRAIINGAFGTDVCTPAIGDVNCLSPTLEGKPVIQVFLDAFLPVVQADIESAGRAVRERLRPEVGRYLTDRTDVDAMSDAEKDTLLRRLLEKS